MSILHDIPNLECDYCREPCFTQDGIVLPPTFKNVTFCSSECVAAYYRNQIELNVIEEYYGMKIVPAPERKMLAAYQLRNTNNLGLVRADWLTNLQKRKEVRFRK